VSARGRRCSGRPPRGPVADALGHAHGRRWTVFGAIWVVGERGGRGRRNVGDRGSIRDAPLQ